MEIFNRLKSMMERFQTKIVLESSTVRIFKCDGIVEERGMTDKEKKQFKESFEELHKAFEHVDKAFEKIFK